MRKIYLMLASLALPLLANAAESIPYSSDMTTWEIVNVNPTTKTWQIDTTASDFTGSGWSKGLKYSYDTSSPKQPGDDWAISPSIHLEAGVEYKVKFWIKTSSYNERLALYMAQSPNQDDLKAGVKIVEKSPYKNSTIAKVAEIITVEEAGDYYFGFHCFSDPDMFTLYIAGFEVGENKFAPAPVSNFKVVEGADRALEATLSWTLPTTDNDGAALPEDAEFNNVKIYRDGELAATLDGDATTWTDNAENGLTSGKHTYEVMVTVNNSPSAKASYSTKYVGPLVAAPLPWEYITATMTQEDFNTYFSVEKGTGSGTPTSDNFHFYSANNNTANYIYYKPGFHNQENDWLFLPPVKIEHPGVYLFTVNTKYDSTKTAGLEVWYGNAANSASMTNQAGTIATIGSTAEDKYVAVNIAEAGEYVFALHGAQYSESYSPFCFYKFVIQEWHQAPAHATGISTNVTENGIVVKWTNPTKDNTGNDFDTLSKVEVYRDNKLVGTIETDIEKGAESSFTDIPEVGGSFKYYVLPYIGEYSAEGIAETTQSAWYGDKVQTIPYSYNFESIIYNTLYTALDLNGDDFTWEVQPSSYIKLDFNKTSDAQTNKDRILAPPFNFSKPGYYKITMNVRGGAKNSYLKVGLLKEDATDGNLINPQNIALPNLATYKLNSTTIKVEEAGRYCLGIDFNEYSTKSDMAIYLNNLTVDYLPLLPGVATDLTVTPGDNAAMTATLEWTNPSVSSISGVDPVIVKAVISRNGEPVDEVTENLVPGEKTQWTDYEVPTVGSHTYSVEIHGEEGPHAEAAPSVTAPWIGGGMDIPYEPENFNDWTLINVDEDTNTWDDPLSWTRDGNNLKLFTGTKPADEWAISPRLDFEAGEEYVIELVTRYKLGDTASITFDLYHGAGTTADDMTTKIGTVTCPAVQNEEATHTFHIAAQHAAEPALLSDDAEDEEEVEPATPELKVVNVPAGVGTIGFHANKAGNAHVMTFAITKSKDTGISDIEVTDGFSVSGNSIILPAEASDILVADLAGRVIFSTKYASSIDMTALDKGTYIVSASVAGKKVQVKVAK